MMRNIIGIPIKNTQKRFDAEGTRNSARPGTESATQTPLQNEKKKKGLPDWFFATFAFCFHQQHRFRFFLLVRSWIDRSMSRTRAVVSTKVFLPSLKWETRPKKILFRRGSACTTYRIRGYSMEIFQGDHSNLGKWGLYTYTIRYLLSFGLYVYRSSTAAGRYPSIHPFAAKAHARGVVWVIWCFCSNRFFFRGEKGSIHVGIS